jgi:hypothetical protein
VAGHLEDELQAVQLQDQTVRLTLATATNWSKPLPLPPAASDSCPMFSDAATELRESVDITGRAYSRILDRFVSVRDSMQRKRACYYEGLFSSFLSFDMAMLYVYCFPLSYQTGPWHPSQWQCQ